jgi:multidrug resistance efflux pump
MRSNRVITIAVLLGIVIVAVTFLGAAHMSGDDPAKSAKEHKTAPVKSGSGGVVIFGQVDLNSGLGLLPIYPEAFPQPSRVVKVFVTEGQQVKKGDKLIELDSDIAQSNVKIAEGGLAEALAALKQAESTVDQATNTLQAQDFAVKSMEQTVASKRSELSAAKVRLDDAGRKLRPAGAENDPDYQAAKKSYEAAEKALQAEQIKLDGMKAITPIAKKNEALAAVERAKAAITVQEATLNEAKIALRMMTVTAPVDGLIIRSSVAEGLTFGPQTREPAFSLQPKGDFIVRAEVDQEFASRIAVGQDAVIHDDGNAALRWTGKVLRISDAFLPKRNTAAAPGGLLLNDSRVLECIVSISGNDQIRLGQRVRVSIGME